MQGNAKVVEEEEEANLDDHLIDNLIENAMGVADAKKALQDANAAFEVAEVVVEDALVAVLLVDHCYWYKYIIWLVRGFGCGCGFMGSVVVLV